MSSAGKKLRLKCNTVTINLSCGSCRKPKLSDIFDPKPKSKSKPKQQSVTSSPVHYTSRRRHSHTSSSDDTRTVSGFGKISDESVAVEKDSDDPYLDFRQSMLQMILENRIYSKEDLRELLNCFLQLNSPYHHGIIVRAFTEIWNGVLSVKYNNNGSSSR